jgi:hypothetical protein
MELGQLREHRLKVAIDGTGDDAEYFLSVWTTVKEQDLHL